MRICDKCEGETVCSGYSRNSDLKVTFYICKQCKSTIHFIQNKSGKCLGEVYLLNRGGDN